MSELTLAVFASETGTHLVRPPRGQRWRAFERRFDERAYLERLAAGGHHFLARSSPDFPPLLRAIHDPPTGLFLRGEGEPELLARPAVAIVGARASSGYGASVARSLGRELAAAGLVVVSGLARGIDAEAHRGALEADGTTVAVLGCGIDRDYPAAHAELARRVADAGLIVSEYAPGVEPAPWRFPARNRIVAGLCAATGLQPNVVDKILAFLEKQTGKPYLVWQSEKPDKTPIYTLASRKPSDIWQWPVISSAGDWFATAPVIN